MEPLLERLSGKDHLDVSDASDLLQFLQCQSEPILSHHTSPSTTTSRSSPTVAHTTAAVAVARSGSRSHNCSDLARSNTLDSCTRDVRNTSAPVLLSRDLESTRNVATPPGPSPSLGGQARKDHSASKTELDINSWSEFPPMLQMNKTPQRTSKSSEKNKMKSPVAKPGRRITLTPLPSQPPPLSHFSASPNSSGNCWKSNPAFTNHFTASESSPSSLSEERRLLKEERSRRRQKHGSRTAPPLQRDAGVRKPSPTTTTYNSTARNKVSISAQRGQQFKGHSSTGHHGGSLEVNVIDLKISTHSIFELNHGRNSSKRNDFSRTMSSRMDASYEAMSGQRSISTLSATNQPPVTSTPLPTRECSQYLSHASPSNVTHQDALDLLSSHYATLITDHMLPNLTSEIHFILQLLTSNVPHIPNVRPLSANGESSDLFDSVDNCVYFAVAVLDKIRHLLEYLDRSTLQLLAENPRVAEFNPDLSSYFAQVCASNSSFSGHPSLPLPLDPNHSGSARGRSFGVPFHEATDNSRNFPSMKAFHAFKKQRDLFYLILREWEENSGTPNWSMKTALADKIQVLIQQHGDVCSLAHFARLFQRQLVESCRHPLQYQLNPSTRGTVESDLHGGEGGGSGSLVRQLGKTDPQRLMRLTERFFLPSSSIVGPRPPPSFSIMEEFFTDFILTADSYEFNHHLKATLCTELVKLHNGCVSLHPKDVTDTVHTMQSLAKFLGFLHFLPYRKPAPDSAIQAREMMPDPLPLVQCVLESCDLGHLCVTVPWVVTYLSMMDCHAHKITSVSSLITTLIDVYRSLSLREGTCMSGRTHLMIATTLGWLFESPEFPSTLFFDYVRTHPSPSITLTHTPDSLDSKDVVGVDLLYTCCHYLGEFRSLLAGFAAGLQPKASPMRKITPISADIDRVETNPAKQLQVQLRENFFRGHPAYLKQLCDVTSERVSASAITHCESKLLPQTIAGGVRKLTTWLRGKCSLVGVASEVEGVVMEDNHKEPFTQSEAERKIFQVIFETSQVASEKVDRFIASYCHQQATKALEALLTESLSNKVIETASEITGDWAEEKCLKWSTEKLRGIAHEELTKAFEKTKRALKAVLKSKDMQMNDTISSLNHQHHHWRQQQRCDVISTFASSISNEVAQSKHVDLDSSMEHFKEIAKHALSEDKPLSLPDFLPELQGLLDQLCCHVYLSAFVTPHLPVPQAISVWPSEQILSLSADLAVKLIAQGLLTRQKPVASCDLVNNGLLNGLLLYWKLMKSLKLDIPIYGLLNEEAFTEYFNNGSPLVWVCLADVIVGVVEEAVTSSVVVEGLWMCRIHLLKDEQVRTFCQAAAVFLETWYSQDRALSPRHSTHLSNDGHSLSLPPPLSSQLAPSMQAPETRLASLSHHVPFSSPSSLSKCSYKSIHFVRLLSFVLSQLGSHDIPVSLLSHELSSLSSVVTHQSTN